MESLTIKEALEQGYKYAGYESMDEQCLIKVDKMNQQHFDDATEETGNLVLCTLKPYQYTIDADKIRELVSDYLLAQDEVADEDGELADLACGANFETLADDINTRLSKKNYYDLTDIKLTP